MRFACGAMLIAALHLSVAARADLPAGTYAPDIEAAEWLNTDPPGEPVSLAEHRGRVVVLFFWVSWHPGGEDVMPLMVRVNASQFGRDAGVVTIGVTDADRRSVEEMLRREKVFFPVATGAKKTVEEYDLDGYPRCVVIDTEGKIAWSGWPIQGAEGGGLALIEAIGKVHHEKPPTRTHPENAHRAESYLREARQLLGQDAFRRAYEAATRAYELTLNGDPLKARCQDYLDLIDALGRDRFAQAEWAIEEKRWDEGVGYLVQVSREFRGTEVGRSASRKLRALRKRYKEIEQILMTLEDSRTAEALLARALRDIRERRFGTAWQGLETIANDFSDSEAATKSQTVRSRMEQNPRVMREVRDFTSAPHCRRLMSQAESFAQRGNLERARALYREILDSYPETTWADQAAKRLAEMF